MYRSIKILDPLTEQLKMDGFTINRSGLCIRLLPKRRWLLEARRYLSTVSVNLIGARKDDDSKHIDGFFCKKTMRQLEEYFGTKRGVL